MHGSLTVFQEPENQLDRSQGSRHILPIITTPCVCPLLAPHLTTLTCPSTFTPPPSTKATRPIAKQQDGTYQFASSQAASCGFLRSCGACHPPFGSVAVSHVASLPRHTQCHTRAHLHQTIQCQGRASILLVGQSARRPNLRPSRVLYPNERIGPNCIKPWAVLRICHSIEPQILPITTCHGESCPTRAPRSGLNVVPHHASRGYLNISLFMSPGGLEMAIPDRRSSLPKTTCQLGHSHANYRCTSHCHSLSHIAVPYPSRLHYNDSQKASRLGMHFALPICI